MPRIPEETLQQILAATDIVDLVGRSVKLKRSGSGYSGLCPFHQEKTPSFHVSPSRNSYHCFGCGAGGSAFRFVQEHENLSFLEAVKRLGDAAGIRIEESVWDENAERDAKVRSALLRVHADIAQWYHALLMKHQAAEPARAYLKSRGINSAIAENWQMGYAPARGDSLREWAMEKKYSENILLQAGILKRGDEDSGRSGETYPHFRHRLMFPIRNDYGEVIAFSGRLLDPGAKAAKYVNSPETPIFSKSKVFFGLDKSKRAISKANRAIVCEGQLDLITAFENGFENVVAPLGTAFTEFHARMLKRHAEEVVLCFDSDAAGYKAAERAFAILAPAGLIVKIAPLPPGEDPDSLIRGKGAEAFRAQIDAARDFFDHLLDFASTTRDLNETREKTRFAADTAALIRVLDNPIARDAAIQKVALRLGIPESEYRRQVARIAHSPQARANAAQGSAPSQELPPQDKTAALLTQLALSDPEILRWLRGCEREEILKDVTGTELLALVWRSQDDLCDASKLAGFFSTLSREEETALTRLLAQRTPEGGKAEAEQALEALSVKRAQGLYEKTRLRLKQPNLPRSEMVALYEEYHKLKDYLDRVARLKDIPAPTAT